MVPASGSVAYQHFIDTINKKRRLSELTRFIPNHDIDILKGMYHETPFAVWGARPTEGNARKFDQMQLGDYILFVVKGKIKLIGEVAWKLKNSDLAKNFWGENSDGETWENIYFIINEKELNLPAADLWKYLGYSENFAVQGLMAVDEDRVSKVENSYGGFYDVLIRLNEGKKIAHRAEVTQVVEDPSKLSIEKDEKPTDHTEIQWRLVHLAHAAKVDVWVPRSDQNKEWEGHRLGDTALKDFKEGLDIPRTVENIDAVWRLGYQIKAAFEIEHSTSIYSGLLRLSDLKTIAPNIVYPLYIAAPEERKDKVMSELRRPTFHDQLRLHEAVRFISYDRIRELDRKYGEKGSGFTIDTLDSVSEKVA